MPWPELMVTLYLDDAISRGAVKTHCSDSSSAMTDPNDMQIQNCFFFLDHRLHCHCKKIFLFALTVMSDLLHVKGNPHCFRHGIWQPLIVSGNVNVNVRERVTIIPKLGFCRCQGCHCRKAQTCLSTRPTLLTGLLIFPSIRPAVCPLQSFGA